MGASGQLSVTDLGTLMEAITGPANAVCAHTNLSVVQRHGAIWTSVGGSPMQIMSQATHFAIFWGFGSMLRGSPMSLCLKNGASGTHWVTCTQRANVLGVPPAGGLGGQSASEPLQ